MKYLINMGQGCYYSVSPDGDSTVINYTAVSIKETSLPELAAMSSSKLIDKGYVPIDKEHYDYVLEKVTNYKNKQNARI